MFEHDCRNCSIAGSYLGEVLDKMWNKDYISWDEPVPMKKLKKRFKKAVKAESHVDGSPRFLWFAVLDHAGRRDLEKMTYGELDSYAYEMEETAF